MGPPLQAPEHKEKEIREQLVRAVERPFIGLHTGRHIRSQLLPANVMMAGMHPDIQARLPLGASGSQSALHVRAHVCTHAYAHVRS